MEQVIEKGNFNLLNPIFSNSAGLMIDFLKKSLYSFFDEMDLYIEKNEDEGFWWFQLERTLLSIYLNGIVRNDLNKEVTVLQEYAVWDESKKSMRCDAFVNYKSNVFLIEAKKKSDSIRIKENHWDIDAWLDDDEIIVAQLEKYYQAQENYIKKDLYQTCQLMTIVFANIKMNPSEHAKKAKEELEKKNGTNFKRDWFYTFLFDNDITNEKEVRGLEVYGTIKNITL